MNAPFAPSGPYRDPQRVPRCPLHIAVEMKLEEARAPIWLVHPDGTDGCEPKSKRRTRKFWKCPLEGCRRVAAYLPTDEEEKEMAARTCPRCGAPSDADATLRAIGRNACRKCVREKHETRMGLGKGFYAKAKALRRARQQQEVAA
jgi:hypothetical protein